MSISSIQDLYGGPSRISRRAIQRLVLAGALVLTAGAVAGVLLLPGESTANEEDVLARGLSQAVYPAMVVARVPAPVDSPFRLPAAAVTIGDTTLKATWLMAKYGKMTKRPMPIGQMSTARTTAWYPRATMSN